MESGASARQQFTRLFTHNGYRRDRVKTLVKAALFSGLVAAAAGASAQTATGTFDVLANVQATCTVSAGQLDFGQYDPFSATPRDGTSTFTVTCTNGTTYGVSIPTPTARQMARAGGGATLNYGLWNDSGRTAPFGIPANSATGTGAAQPRTLYGRIPAGQTTALAGSYSENVTITVTY